MEIDIILNEFTSPHEAAELGLMAEGLRSQRRLVRQLWLVARSVFHAITAGRPVI